MWYIKWVLYRVRYLLTSGRYRSWEARAERRAASALAARRAAYLRTWYGRQR